MYLYTAQIQKAAEPNHFETPMLIDLLKSSELTLLQYDQPLIQCQEK